MRIIKIIFITFMFCSVCFSATEKEWQESWNKAYIKGRLEYRIKYGRVDILTKNYAIEVDHVAKFHEGIGQALHYAYETKRKPGLALFIDGQGDNYKKYKYAKKLAESYNIKVWLMNEIVNPNIKENVK